jgi:hypothetical protein
VGFVVDKVALEQASFQVLQFLPVTVIPPMLHTHLHLSPTLYISGVDKIVKKLTKSRESLAPGNLITFLVTCSAVSIPTGLSWLLDFVVGYSK